MAGLKRWLGTALVALTILFLGRNLIAPIVVSVGVEAVMGLPLRIKSFRVGVFKTAIEGRGLLLMNPAGFSDRVMMDLPQIDVDYDGAAFFKGKIHLRRLRLDLKEFQVIRNEQGQLNLDSLKPLQKAKIEKAREAPAPKKSSSPSFQIDGLELKIGKVVFRDYSVGTPPRITEFNVGVDERYRNVQDPSVLAGLIVTRALVKTTIANLTHLDLSSLQGWVTGALYRSTGTLTQTTQGVAKGAAGVFKKILPFEREQN